MSNLLQQLNADMASVVGDVRQSLVQISTGRGHGAGTIWHADGLIVTNAHVVEHARGPLTVTLPDGTQRPAQVLARDPDHDLAALAVDANDLTTTQLGNSKLVKPGQWVFAIGHPWGVLGAASAGIIIGCGAEWPEMPLSGKDWIVVSLKVRPGNSGGPLVDVNGRLIGINTLMTGPQVGVAIPVHTVKSFLKEALGSRVETPVERVTEF